MDYLLRHENKYECSERWLLGISTISDNNEPWVVRIISVASGTCVGEFRDAVRERDGRRVITGEVVRNAYRGFWTGFPGCPHISSCV
ncbi:hypothetical protein BDZ91DRAFT_720503 [Kalaharituber pfeilii]|nr:hypothetical protein BDZ91DRAFT_720503 [Kalaharituber pfeilii]